jgi:hypothetical protein
MPELTHADLEALVVALLNRMIEVVPIMTKVSDAIVDYSANPDVGPDTAHKLALLAKANLDVAGLLTQAVNTVQALGAPEPDEDGTG